MNSAVDHSAARVLRAAAAADLRRNLEARRARRSGGKRRHSADYLRPTRRLAGIDRHSLDVRSRHPLQLLSDRLAAVHGSDLSKLYWVKQVRQRAPGGPAALAPWCFPISIICIARLLGSAAIYTFLRAAAGGGRHGRPAAFILVRPGQTAAVAAEAAKQPGPGPASCCRGGGAPVRPCWRCSRANSCVPACSYRAFELDSGGTALTRLASMDAWYPALPSMESYDMPAARPLC